MQTREHLRAPKTYCHVVVVVVVGPVKCQRQTVCYTSYLAINYVLLVFGLKCVHVCVMLGWRTCAVLFVRVSYTHARWVLVSRDNQRTGRAQRQL